MISLTFFQTVFSQKQAYQITATINGWQGDKAYLGYRRADKVYSKDTVEINNGRFVFQGEEPLPPGVYLILMPPDNKFFEFVVTKAEQNFSLETTAPEFFKNLKFKGTKDNQLLYAYQTYMAEQVEASKKLQEKIDDVSDEKEKEKLKKELEELGKSVRKHQDKIVVENPGTYTAKLIRAFQEPEVPEPPKKADGSIDSTFQWRYFKAHFLDGFDFSEEAFVNTPYLKEKVDRYIGEKMTMQTPDSVIAAVDMVLGKAEANKEVFKWTLSYLLNKYYTPEIMGLDAVYVHLSDKYYASGKADWVTEESLKKITDDAYMIRNVLIGNKAPDVRVQLYDPATHSFPNDKLISLYDVKAEYTVVFLWKPGCGHCKHTSDELKPFYEEWKNKGVEIFSISSANHTELDKALDDVKEKNMPWIVTADPYLKARALQKFYGVSLPKLYLLDKDKKIVASRVGVPQLPTIIENHRKTLANK
jgi:thiol-disulfide isomerase/thioredoxin